MVSIADFVKKRRKQLGLTQEEFAKRAGVALTVLRKIEQGKNNLSLSKANQVLLMFGHTLGPVKEHNYEKAIIKYKDARRAPGRNGRWRVYFLLQ